VDILAQIRAIASYEGVNTDDAALALLAEAGDGSMRDALSIMDQAIASAPLEDGKPRLDAAQIRELMGTVPNAVFERVLEAVDGNRSAEVITIANELLDAGNSPAQLARQCVRYLRNCVIAKIAGVGADGSGLDGAASELLQISADEQRRAGRSAALFTEEELTRFLQVMLKTFDELGYRQEQRFHFELGLLKLVHLRRLLPVEEVLSRFPVPGGSGGGAQPVRPRTPNPAAQPARSTAPASSIAVPAKPAFSPFASDSSRKSFSDPAPPSSRAEADPSAKTTPVVTAVSVIEDEPETEITPVVVAADLPGVGAAPVAALEPEAPSVEEAVSSSPATPSGTSPSAGDLQRVATEALSAAKSQGSAADVIADSEWTIEGGEIRVQTALSKTMLPMVINPDADRVVRAALRTAGAGSLKLVLLPGAANADAPKKSKPARTGSAQAKALDHPVVQQAQRLFNAEIRNVIDLRDTD
jgi:DNA polymerase-3 subunit gamma/tau